MVDGISLGDGIIRTKSCARTEFRFLHQLDGIPVESDLYFARFVRSCSWDVLLRERKLSCAV